MSGWMALTVALAAAAGPPRDRTGTPGRPVPAGTQLSREKDGIRTGDQDRTERAGFEPGVRSNSLAAFRIRLNMFSGLRFRQSG